MLLEPLPRLRPQTCPHGSRHHTRRLRCTRHQCLVCSVRAQSPPQQAMYLLQRCLISLRVRTRHQYRVCSVKAQSHPHRAMGLLQRCLISPGVRPRVQLLLFERECNRFSLQHETQAKAILGYPATAHLHGCVPASGFFKDPIQYQRWPVSRPN